MILRPKSLMDLKRQLLALPEERRKVIVFVGRQGHEGTIKIANRHHRDWEEHGAVVVRIPRAWTPHGFWHSVTPRTTDQQITKRIRAIPSDSDITRFLLQQGIGVPVVRFHSTPSEPFGMRYFVSQSSNFHHPVFTPTGEFLLYHNDVLAEFFFPGRRQASAIQRL